MAESEKPTDKRIGNQFWKARTKHGRDKLFANEGILFEACCEYFEWVDANPLQEEKATQFQGEFIKGTVSKMRAMTLTGLCIFLDIDLDTWSLYRKRDDFIGVTKKVEAIIYDQKFSGASADLLNANIIARDLGLADKKDLSSTDGSMSPIDPDKYAEARAQMLKNDDC